MERDVQRERPVEPPRPRRVRLPGFIVGDEELGLGEAVKRATYRLGFEACAACERRAAAMNNWLVFTRR